MRCSKQPPEQTYRYPQKQEDHREGCERRGEGEKRNEQRTTEFQGCEHMVPYDWTLLPFGSACSQEASVQVPTSWSLIDHCWLIALLGNVVSPNIMILRTLRRFMFPSPRC